MYRACAIALWMTVTVAVFSRAAEGEAPRGGPPNFVVILADDLGAGELGCYGNSAHRTPNLDRLAETGMRFQTCWATPLCSPTRVMLMTGRYGFRTGWYNLIGRPGSPKQQDPQYDLGQNHLTFAEVLKPRGYATALSGKWQLSGVVPTLIHDCGFDEYRMWAYKHNLPPGVTHTGGWENRKTEKTARYWHPCILTDGRYSPTKPDDYGPDLFTDFLIDFIRRHKDRPFLAYHPMCLTHAPHDPTPDPNHPGKRTPEGLKSNVEYLDHLVGRITAALDEMGLRKNTIILFTGDNGTGGAGKGKTIERGVRVPLIVNGPGTVRAGVVSDALISLSDVLPTLAELAGAPLPSGRVIDGRSFAPILRGEKGNPREWVFSYLVGERMLRDRRWLLEGDGRFFDCGSSRDGSGYREVSDSRDPEVVAARKRFESILAELPAPDIKNPDATPGRKAE